MSGSIIHHNFGNELSPMINDCNTKGYLHFHDLERVHVDTFLWALAELIFN
jgi:hypothetical protein